MATQFKHINVFTLGAPTIAAPKGAPLVGDSSSMATFEQVQIFLKECVGHLLKSLQGTIIGQQC